MNEFKLSTNHLLLRRMQMDDAQAIFKYRSDHHANQHQGWIPNSMNDVTEFILKLSPQINLPDTWFQLVIIEIQSNNLIGDIGIHFLGSDNRQVEIGCTLDKNHQDKGYATEALQSVINYLFFELDKHSILCFVDPGNLKSLRLVERLGFRKEAHYIKSIHTNTGWVDDIFYVLLAKEWPKQHI